jgi:hypothetical protein
MSFPRFTPEPARLETNTTPPVSFKPGKLNVEYVTPAGVPGTAWPLKATTW